MENIHSIMGLMSANGAYINAGNSENGVSFSSRHQNKPKRTNRLTMKKRVKLRHKLKK
jgi:hypothetical protein